jgi:hypothetical protein
MSCKSLYTGLKVADLLHGIIVSSICYTDVQVAGRLDGVGCSVLLQDMDRVKL